ncbi:hypothetical protein [Paraglaciecola psychrophila]|uniref:hypothetical protein n=1 Tax=Paraglaciecola psychrophila TaxID=326544 RepID=UPI0011D1F206|nr:hypothetical protein [Paraglaciecola psychrophila]
MIGVKYGVLSRLLYGLADHIMIVEQRFNRRQHYACLIIKTQNLDPKVINSFRNAQRITLVSNGDIMTFYLFVLINNIFTNPTHDILQSFNLGFLDLDYMLDK